jgi:hypothetical protein
VITIGIDPHKSSLTAVSLDAAGGEIGQIRLAVDQDLGLQLLEWAQAWPQRQWAVEGATGLGRGVAQLLAAAGQSVLDVPAKLAARARLLGSGSSRKTTSPMPRRSPRSRNAISDSARSKRRTTPWSCGCCRIDVTIWSPSEPAL